MALQGLAQGGVVLVTLDHLFHHAGLEHLVAVALALGVVHGHVGVAQQLVDVVAGRGADGDADAAAHHDLFAPDRERRGQALDDPPGDTLRVGLAGQALDQESELVAPHPGSQIGRAQALLQAGGHRRQHAVADLMTDAVVDGLEVVQIDEEHGEHGAVGTALQRLLCPLHEQAPVGQTRQGVVGGLVLQPVPQGAHPHP